ncbi:MAG: hypothetical protein Q4F00_13220 [bacterium]|nr:hypothetical protein [bacterium]
MQTTQTDVPDKVGTCTRGPESDLQLLRCKVEYGEKELKPALPVISGFIKTECGRLKEAAAAMLSTPPVD